MRQERVDEDDEVGEIRRWAAWGGRGDGCCWGVWSGGNLGLVGYKRVVVARDAVSVVEEVESITSVGGVLGEKGE